MESMLKHRLIPKLQLINHDFGTRKKMVLVTTNKFDNPKIIGDPVSQAKIYESQAADELIFTVIRPHENNKEELVQIINKVCKEVFMPITVGGGIKTINDIRLMLSNGADKVSLNSAFIENPDLINEASYNFGASTIVASIDFKKEGNRFIVYSNSGKNPTKMNLLDWALEVEERGAGELLLTSVDRDGTREGLELDAIQQVADKTKIPIVASGGCGFNKHFVEAYKQLKISGVAAGTYFSFKDENPMQTRGQIFNSGVAIRLHT